jgi:membrane-associated protease RseP (regulator of RpoE activity)
MVGTSVWILAGIGVYLILIRSLRARDMIPSSVDVQGPITTIRTERGQELLDRLAERRRFWRGVGTVGRALTVALMLATCGGILLVTYKAIFGPSVSPTEASLPQTVLVVTGFNNFLPAAAAPQILFGLVLGLMGHELGHGLLCRVEDIDVDEMGLKLITILPIAAFVTPDEASRQDADRHARTRMFAAGVTTNVAVAAVCFLLLFGPVMSAVTLTDGAPVGDVLERSSAAQAGVERGDVVTAINGTAVTNQDEFYRTLSNHSSRQLRLSFADREDVVLDRSLLVTQIAPGVVHQGSEGGGITARKSQPPTIVSVNGTRVYTKQDFVAATSNGTMAHVETTNGSATIPIGASVRQVVDGGPMDEVGAKTEGIDSFVITQIGDERTRNYDSLLFAIAEMEVGEETTVVAYVDGARTTYDVTLQEHPRRDGDPFLGVVLHQGTSGISVNDVGIDAYPSDFFLGLLKGGSAWEGTLTERVTSLLALPFVVLIYPSVSYGFTGFIGPVTSYYEVTGPLGALGDGGFVLATLLLWTGWINLQLGLFNSIPLYPLDGAHLLRSGTEGLAERLSVSDPRSLARKVTAVVSFLMLAGLLVIMFGPDVLGF